MKITDIRSRQPVRIEDDQMLMIIGAALGGTVSFGDSGTVDIQPWKEAEPEPLCLLFRSMFDGRQFADLQSLASVVIDMQLEQLALEQQDAARYRWLRNPNRNSDKECEDMGEAGTVGLIFVSSGNHCSEAAEAESLDRAIDAAIEAVGAKVKG